MRETQTGCAVALQFDIVPESERLEVAANLARMVREVGGRVSTGFLGTPLVLPALSSSGFYDEAYAMLLRNEFPSWLYQVEMGATTVWERWDAIRPDGSIHPGTMSTPFEEDGESEEGNMLSFNHYAYGAVIDWVYRHLAGIAPDWANRAIAESSLHRGPTAGISWARASVDTPHGRAAISWNLESDAGLAVDLEIPFGSTGVFIAPVTAESTIRLDGRDHGARIELLPGHHRVEVTRPLVGRSLAGNSATVSGSLKGALRNATADHDFGHLFLDPDISNRLPLGRGHSGLPDRRRSRRGRSGAIDLGHLFEGSREHPQRGHGRCRV